MKHYSGTDNLEVMAEAANYNNFLLALIRENIKKGDRILDIGAGIGTFGIPLTKEGYLVRCVEPDESQAALIAAAGLPVSRSVSDIEDDSLDFSYAMNVLEHIKDDTGALRTWLTKLRVGGRMLVYVPAFDLLYSSMDKKVGHHRRYSLGTLSNRATDAGFAIETIRYVDSLGFFAALMYKVLGNESGDINKGALIIYDRFVFPLSRLLDRLFDRQLGKNVALVAVRAK